MRPLSRWLAGALAASSAAGAAQAHVMGPAEAAAPPGWTWDLSVTAPLALALALFGAGWLRLRARSRRGGGKLERRALLFIAGWSSLALALVSPLHQAGERAFSAHMAEHETMMLLAAPLLVLSGPLAIMLWAFPAPARVALGRIGQARAAAAAWRAITRPVTATLVQAAALWAWHAPALFDLALGDPAWHVVQHLCFLVSALLFWTAMLQPGRGDKGVAVLCLFATSVVSGALGALMAFSESPWYAAYAQLGVQPFGLTPAEDQQVAGLLMWIPGGLVHIGAALALIGSVLRAGIGRAADAR